MLRMTRVARIRAGEYFEHRGNFRGAERLYRAALDAHGLQQSAFHLGNVLYRQTKYEEAIPFLSAALREEAVVEQAHLRMATALLRLQRFDEAERTLRSLLTCHESVRGRKMLVQLLLRQGRDSEAHSEIAAFIDETDDQSLDESYLKSIDKDAPAWQRADAMAKIAERHSSDGAWLYRFGTTLKDSGRLAFAARVFDDAAHVGSNSWWYYKAGYSWHVIGDENIARDRYGKAIELDKKFDAQKWGIGAFHDEAGVFDLAGRSYRDLSDLEQNPGVRAELLSRAGASFARAMMFDDAVEAYSWAVDLRPTNLRWMSLLATSQKLGGDLDAATATMRRAIFVGMQENSGEVMALERQLGRFLFEKGEYAEAYCFLAPERRGSASFAPNRKQTVSTEYVKDVAAVQPPCELRFRGSADQEGYSERAQQFYAIGDATSATREWRKAALCSLPLPGEIAEPLAELLANSGRWQQADEALLLRTLFSEPVPEGAALPKKDSYNERLAVYSEYSSFSCLVDVILYETNLGLSVDCNPLALCRRLLVDRPGSYIHVWAVNSEVSLPKDILSSSDVVVVEKESFAYVMLLARAKYLVNNSTFPTYFTRRNEQRYLMTWHGTPLKTLGKDEGTPLGHANMARNYLQASYAIFPNEHTRRILMAGCDVEGITSARVEITGYPRNDRLARLPIETGHGPGQKIAVFAPTWREDSELEKQVQILLSVREVLEVAGYETKLRAHHYVEKEAARIDPTIEFVPRNVSTYDLLPDADLLVTDFSSIYFDFAITRRPIVFYVPDWDRYAKNRGVYFGPEHLPGAVCRTIEELREAVADPVVDQDSRSVFLEEFAPMDDGRASERVLSRFLDDDPHVDRADRVVIDDPLFRQSLIPNGMSSSFVNLIVNLRRRGDRPVLLTDSRALQQESGRVTTLSRLPGGVRVLGRIGPQPKTRLEFHALRIAHAVETRSRHLEATIDRCFDRESERILPANFSRRIEFDGYSEFMARLVLAIGGGNGMSGIYLHSDLAEEIDLRVPTLKDVVAILPRFDAVVSVSQGLLDVNRAKLGSRYGIGTANFAYARNLIVPDQIKRLSEQSIPDGLRSFFDWAGPKYIQVGRISPEKNHRFTLDVAKRLQESGSEARFLVIGDGALLPDLRAAIRSEGLAKSVYTFGYLSNPYSAMSLCDGLLLPSLHEGQPMVILESLICGVPVFASDIPGVRAMSELASLNILPLNTEEWAAALIDPSLRRRPEFCGEHYVADALAEFDRVFDRGVEKCGK